MHSILFFYISKLEKKVVAIKKSQCTALHAAPTAYELLLQSSHARGTVAKATIRKEGEKKGKKMGGKINPKKKKNGMFNRSFKYLRTNPSSCCPTVRAMLLIAQNEMNGWGGVCARICLEGQSRAARSLWEKRRANRQLCKSYM